VKEDQPGVVARARSEFLERDDSGLDWHHTKSSAAARPTATSSPGGSAYGLNTAEALGPVSKPR
jgi:hypothetical protein